MDRNERARRARGSRSRWLRGGPSSHRATAGALARILPCAMLCAVTALAGCGGGQPVAVRTVLNYDQCQGIDAGLTRVDLDDVAGIRGSTLLRMSGPQESGAAGAPPNEPLLIAISRGRQPTPGYRLTADGAQRRDATAVIRLTWESPASGAVLPQMTTHPCVVVSLEPAEWRSVEAVDQTGRPIGSLTLTGLTR